MTEKVALQPLYEANDFPIFQNRMYETASEARSCPVGNIRLVEDHETGLVYNADFCPSLMQYDGNYQNEQAVSPRFRTHLEEVAQVIQKHFGQSKLVEIGCGKGTFLEMLLDIGIDVIGFDPTYEGDNPRVFKEYFRSGYGFAADGIVLRHVLEHVKGPFQFLRALQQAIGGVGKIYIEVPSFEWICKQRAWFDIFYEHVNYFRLCDFHRMFDTIYASGTLFGDQYLYVVADLSSLQQPKFDPSDRVQFPADFLQGLVSRIKASGTTPSVIWGGASKGVIFALMSERIGRPVSTVIDVNPAKQDRYLPGTGIRVQSPMEVLPKLPAESTIFVMNSNYLSEIQRMSNDAYNYVSVDHYET